MKSSQGSASLEVCYAYLSEIFRERKGTGRDPIIRLSGSEGFMAFALISKELLETSKSILPTFTSSSFTRDEDLTFLDFSVGEVSQFILKQIERFFDEAKGNSPGVTLEAISFKDGKDGTDKGIYLSYKYPVADEKQNEEFYKRLVTKLDDCGIDKKRPRSGQRAGHGSSYQYENLLLDIKYMGKFVTAVKSNKLKAEAEAKIKAEPKIKAYFEPAAAEQPFNVEKDEKQTPPLPVSERKQERKR